MLLSEAMRLGAMLRGQTFGLMFSESGSCALGAATEATGTRYDEDGGDMCDAWDRWPWLLSVVAIGCPACELTSQASVVIAHLNDSHEWPREQIADWVATVEPRETPSVTAASDCIEALA